MTTYEHVQRRVSDILDIPSPPGDVIGRWFDRFIVTLIILNVAAVILESIQRLHEAYAPLFRIFEFGSVAIFATEYVLRVWAATAKPAYARPVLGRLRFMATPFALVDLIAILPVLFVVVDLRFIRVLRMLRLLKITKYSDSFRVLSAVLRRSARELTMALSLVLLALLLLSTLMYYAEREAQPEVFANIPSALYWGIIAITTTGYGDIVPITVAGKLIAGATGIVGVAVIALPVGILASGFVEELKGARKAEACPHCGNSLPAK